MNDHRDPCACPTCIHLRVIFDLWEVVAIIAWTNFLVLGRGLVRVVIDDGYPYVNSYEPKPDCESCAKLVEAYDPETQVAVAVTTILDSDEIVVTHHLVEGWPAPPEAEALTPPDHRPLPTQ